VHLINPKVASLLKLYLEQAGFSVSAKNRDDAQFKQSGIKRILIKATQKIAITAYLEHYIAQADNPA
jgi:tRNA(Ser,Leu) C12 N-acetylase TAN1